MSTWIIGGLVALAAALAVHNIYKNKKAGKCSCGCSAGCSGCAGACHCHQHSNA